MSGDKRTPPLPTDAQWLDAAAGLAWRGRPSAYPNPAVGCLIVRDGRTVGRGWTQPGGRPHAEAMALAEAGEAAHGADVFVTLEPCAHDSGRGPACADLLAAAGPGRVIVGVQDPDPRTAGRGVERLQAAGIAAEFGPLKACEQSLAGYLMRQRSGRPFVTLKLAVSLDGCVALANGSSRWITGAAARAHVHSRRALSDAILVGGGTWRIDRPKLNVRLTGLGQLSPRPIVLTRGDVPPGILAIREPAGIHAIDAHYLYVEGGAMTAASFLAQDLVDRLELYRAPIVIGGGVPGISDLGLHDLASAHGRWRLAERRTLGSDLFEAFTRIR
ncbi:bifunctional diaminohydroxyphosphoribosylaminopyrimidine deaminase/5-amino-6-(5-phosphoribosylamino)uracil reductase RibD [Qipengyuania sp.]|uniref:bifunctional diaminohydroxyphosphoribosylaminopyrimidine deaminase/5-amino-6-(5-phosphoribosylamino)uracil reductase RibD n=1 Tax=Qipengyuania sp. TaxID=2004515 RepID=UPI0037360A3C